MVRKFKHLDLITYKDLEGPTFNISSKKGTFYPWNLDKSLPYGKSKKVFSGYAEKFFQVSITVFNYYVGFRIKYSVNLIGPEQAKTEYKQLIELKRLNIDN